MNRAPLDREESEFAKWLQTLDDSSVAPDHVRAQVLKKLSEMYMLARTNEVSLQAELESAQRENGELREFRRKVAALTIESKVGGVVLVPDREVGMAERVIARMKGEPALPLRLVRPGEPEVDRG